MYLRCIIGHFEVVYHKAEAVRFPGRSCETILRHVAATKASARAASPIAFSFQPSRVRVHKTKAHVQAYHSYAQVRQGRMLTT